MKTTKEFFDRLASDEPFAKEIGEKAKARIETGVTDYKALWIPLAAEYGYELTADELDEKHDSLTADMSEEELGKVAVGTTPTVLLVSLASVTVLDSITVIAATTQAAKQYNSMNQ